MCDPNDPWPYEEPDTEDYDYEDPEDDMLSYSPESDNYA
jgi:hypothetical protein